VELRQLSYFVVTAEELHFGRAARRVHIAQPSLTQQIQRLETELGVRLFDRNSHEVTLTQAGELFLAKARTTLRQAMLAADTARWSKRTDRPLRHLDPYPVDGGTVRVGFTSPAALRVLPNALRRLRLRHPRVVVALQEMWSGQQLSALLAAELDVGFVCGPVRDRRLRSRTVLREPMVVLLPAGHRLAAVDHIGLDELAGEPQVLFHRHLSPAVYDQLRGHATDRGALLNVQHTVSHPSAIPLLVGAGHAIALSSAARAAQLPRAGLVRRPLAGAGGGVGFDVTMVWRAAPEAPALRALLSAVGMRPAGPAHRKAG